MAAEVSDDIEDALNLIVNRTEKSGNMKKGLKQTIYETVSTHRNLFVKLKDNRDSKSAEISKLERQQNNENTTGRVLRMQSKVPRNAISHPQ